MGFLAQRFPEDLSRGMVGGPGFDVTVATLPNAFEQRNINRSASRHAYMVSQPLKVDDWRPADSFFRKARGRGHSFRFKDWTDYQLAVADSSLTQITTTTFQLAKVYGADEPTFQEVRRLTRIVAGTLSVFLNGVLKANPADYTVNIDTGVVTFGVAPGGAVRTASCEFDVPCHFDFDEKKHEMIARRADSGQVFLRWENIRILEDMRG